MSLVVARMAGRDEVLDVTSVTVPSKPFSIALLLQ